MDLNFSLLRLTVKVQGWQCVSGPEECHTVTAICAPQRAPKRFSANAASSPEGPMDMMAQEKQLARVVCCQKAQEESSN